MYKKVYFIGIAAYAFLFFLSVLFYKERCVFLDASYLIFQLVRTGGFCIELYRFGDAFGQLLPVAAYKAGLSLGTITACYSAGLMLFHIACYVTCGSVLKQYRFALIVLLIDLLFATHTFYWPVSQVPQGLALLMVLFALLWGKPIRSIGYARLTLAVLCTIVLAFFHPLMLFAVGYSVVYFLLGKQDGIDNRLLYALAGCFVLLLVIKSLFFRTDYEHHSLSGLKNFVLLFPDYINLYSHRQFLHNCLTIYYWLPISFTCIIVLYARRKVYRQLAFFAFCTIGYLLLVNIMYPFADTPLFYIENLYLPIGLFIALPLVFNLLPALEQKRTGLTTAIICLIIATGCIRVYAAHDMYTHRLNWQRAFLRKNGNTKIIARPTKQDAGTLLMLWGTPYEFWQLSTIEQGRSASIIIDNDPPHRDWAAHATKALVVNWNIYPYSQLDKRFFIFSDTTTGYTIETTPNRSRVPPKL